MKRRARYRLPAYRLYDLIFPLWLLMFIPPFLVATLLGNYLVDGAVILIVLWSNRSDLRWRDRWVLVSKAWLCGLLIDVAAAVLLMLVAGPTLRPLAYYDPLLNTQSAVVYIAIILIAGAAIYAVNRRLATRAGLSRKQAIRLAICMGIVTAPWTFLIPASVIGQ